MKRLTYFLILFPVMCFGAAQPIPRSSVSQYPTYNYLVNPEMQFAQAIDPTGTQIADGGYSLDQWYVLNNQGASNVAKITRTSGQTLSGRQNQNVLTVQNLTVALSQIMVCQPLESDKSKQLRGRQVTFAFFANSQTIGAINLKACIGEWIGTADTITRDVVSSWTATPTWISNFSCRNTVASIPITSSFTQKLVTATVGTSVNNLILCVWNFDALNQNETWQLGLTQLVEGPAAIDWKYLHRSYLENFEQTQFFFQKSYPIDTAPGTTTSSGRVGLVGMFNSATVIGNNTVTINFKVPEFKTAAITTWSPSDGVLGHLDYTKAGTAAASVTATVGGQSARGFSISTTAASGGTAGQAGELLLQYQADARL